MDKDVSAGSATSTTLGHLALGLTLLAFGVGNTGVIDNVAASDAAALATWVGGVALFVVGLLEFRAGNGGTGTAFAGLGAFWFTWGTGTGAEVTRRLVAPLIGGIGVSFVMELLVYPVVFYMIRHRQLRAEWARAERADAS